MKLPQPSAAMLAALALLVASAVEAQVSKDGMGKVLPVELYACKFNDGQGPADLDRVVDRWTEFADERDVDDYAAWTLSPYYYGADQEFDFIWMGAYSDGNAMGRGTQQWLMEGGDIAAEFSAVADCYGHVGLASAMYKSPPDNATPQASVITMTDCKMNDGTKYEDVRDAEIEWADYMTENGSTAGTWHWFPQYGGGDQDFDYKIVSAYADFTELGKDWEHGANGGGREKSQGLFAELDSCNDARVYIATSRRAAQIR